MKRAILISLLAQFLLPINSLSQETQRSAQTNLPDAPNRTTEVLADPGQHAVDPPGASAIEPMAQQNRMQGKTFTAADKARYYFTETYFNPALITAPTFRAGIRMARPPQNGAYQYPSDWRQGAEGFGRNYGDAMAQRLSTHTARFLTGVIMREDPRYIPSTRRNVFARGLHALSFTLVDHSDSGHSMPAISNFVGAAAGGFVGNAYLPAGFNNVSQGGRRAAIEFGASGAGNLFREFAPQIPQPLRSLFMWIGR